VISEDVATRSGIAFGPLTHHDIEIRGRVGRLVVHTFRSARDLPALDGAVDKSRRARQGVA
jgi:hypothetical protein